MDPMLNKIYVSKRRGRRRVKRRVKEVNLILSLIQTPREKQMKWKKSFKKHEFIFKIKMKPSGHLFKSLVLLKIHLVRP